MPEASSPRTESLDTTSRIGHGDAGDHSFPETTEPANGPAPPSESQTTYFLDDAIQGWLSKRRIVRPQNGQGSCADTHTASIADTHTASIADTHTASIEDNSTLRNLGMVKNLGLKPIVPREIKLQEWEGQIERIGHRYFYARLVDLTAGETDESEEVDFPLDDLAESDKKLLVPGAVFRWLIGYRYTQGQKERFSRIVIRRLPIWTTDEIKAADEEAAKVYDILSRDRRDRAAGSNSN